LSRRRKTDKQKNSARTNERRIGMRYVVVDLEMCNVPKLYRKEYRYSQETIQIGAVLLNENFEVTDSFMTYVKPEFGMITTPIVKLTRITPKEVAKAPKMGESLKKFSEWIPEY
jgi:DNA polymerase III epsilon subunit-like protein